MSLKVIGKDAFYNCKNLTSVILQEGLESIENYCFSSTVIKEITIPKTVKSIGNMAFYGCENLINVILQEGLESIGDKCFSGECDWRSNNAPQIR